MQWPFSNSISTTVCGARGRRLFQPHAAGRDVLGDGLERSAVVLEDARQMHVGPHGRTPLRQVRQLDRRVVVHAWPSALDDTAQQLLEQGRVVAVATGQAARHILFEGHDGCQCAQAQAPPSVGDARQVQESRLFGSELVGVRAKCFHVASVPSSTRRRSHARPRGS